MVEERKQNVYFRAVTPQFTVPDLVRTAEYYRDVLGFQIAGYWDGEAVTQTPVSPPVFTIVERDDVRIFFNLAEYHNVRTGRADGAYDAFFHIEGVDTLAVELNERGARLISGPVTQVYGQRELVVEDCNGLLLCFGEDISGG